MNNPKEPMQPDFQRLMQDATRLTRSGDLAAATAAIQSALLARAGSHAPEAAVIPPAGDIVLDVEAREIGSGEMPPSPASAREERFLAGTFGSGRAQRAYKLYVPPQAGDAPLPLVVMLHGCTQDPDDFAAGTRMNEAARELGCFVLYPAQTAQANPQRCWNWFKHSHQERGRGEPALIAAMTREVMAHHAVDASRVYVAGLSAGGAMAAILGAEYPDVFAAVGVHSGLAAGVAKDLPSALAAMRSGGEGNSAGARGVPTIVFHGDADGTVHPHNGQHVIAASMGDAQAAPESGRHRAGAGRSYTRHVHRGADGEVRAEHWVVHGSGHAWSGGSRAGSYTDASGPDATREMLRFFLAHPRR